MEYRVELIHGGSYKEVARKLNKITEEGWALVNIDWRDRHGITALCVLEKSAMYQLTVNENMILRNIWLCLAALTFIHI